MHGEQKVFKDRKQILQQVRVSFARTGIAEKNTKYKRLKHYPGNPPCNAPCHPFDWKNTQAHQENLVNELGKIVEMTFTESVTNYSNPNN